MVIQLFFNLHKGGDILIFAYFIEGKTCFFGGLCGSSRRGNVLLKGKCIDTNHLYTYSFTYHFPPTHNLMFIIFTHDFLVLVVFHAINMNAFIKI